MQITRSSIATGKGRPDWVSGDVHVDLAAPADASRVGGGLVHFNPGARTHWLATP